MGGERVLLTINKDLHKELSKKAKSNFMNIQELIKYILRKEIIKKK